ncbi:hypothetical protein LIA77_05668 [Sarocladium implicatum]|nr:hypothetical protein LIA77_05668 [Sarocladium implicatum]
METAEKNRISHRGLGLANWTIPQSLVLYEIIGGWSRLKVRRLASVSWFSEGFQAADRRGTYNRSSNSLNLRRYRMLQRYGRNSLEVLEGGRCTEVPTRSLITEVSRCAGSKTISPRSPSSFISTPTIVKECPELCG